jgi:sulfate permease, SulP family
MGVAAWLLRLGFVADLLSRPVLVGYMAGVALIMIADQLGRVTGVPVRGQHFFGQLDSFVRGIGNAQPATLGVAAAVLALLRWRWPALPALLMAVLLATAAVAAFSLSSHGPAVVGPIPAGFPVPRLPALHPDTLCVRALPAFTVLIVGFSDDVLTGRSFARRGEAIIAPNTLP